MQAVRYLAPLFVSFAVACGAADASSSAASSTEPTGDHETTAATGTTGQATSAHSTHSTTSQTNAAPLDPTSDEAAPTETSTPASAADSVPASAAEPAAPAGPVANATGLRYRGVNLSGAEFSYTALPGVEGRDYGWPTHGEVDYFTAKGMNTFRVEFLWERIQPAQKGDLNATYSAELDGLVAYATAHGANVVLNPQNFARYYGAFVGSGAVPDASFADLWRRLATRYASNPRVMFNLMNEPNGLPTEQWVSAANAAIAAIRTAGASNVILVPGNAWTGAHSWSESWYGTSNAKAMLDIVDPGNNVLFEVHQYLDDTSGGIVGTCTSATAGSERLGNFIAWLRANGKKGFVGEFAGGNNALCNAGVTDMLKAMNSASDVLEGWLWWGAGPRWTPGYPFSIEPSPAGHDAPQMALLTPFLP